MLNKKTIAIKQDVNQTVRSLLSQIGRVYEVPFSDGRKTLSVILTYEGVMRLGIDLNTVFIGCGGREEFNKGTDVKNGVLVNLDLYQQVALLRAIIEKKPELQDVLGLYNLRGSRKVYEILSREGIPRQLDIWWMWTGDKFVPNQSEANYPEEGIVGLSNLTTLKGDRFALRSVVDGVWYDDYPGFHLNYGAAVFGAQG